MIGTGSFIAIENKNFVDFFATSELSLGIDISTLIMIVVGILVTIISFLGCCGSCTNSKCMMYSFGSLIGIIIIIEIVSSSLVYVYKEKVYQEILEVMDMSLQNYQIPNFEGVTTGWDTLQRELRCCGVINATDWIGKPFQQGTADAPDTCCKLESYRCGNGQLQEKYDKLNADGCLTVIVALFDTKKVLFIAVATAFLAIQLISFCGSFCLSRIMKEDDVIYP